MNQSLTFQPLLFGGDINVYSVARAFHEAYGVRSVAFGKYPSFPCHGSAVIDYRVCPDNESDEAFLRNARAVAEAAALPLKMTCADERLCGELEGRIDPLFPLAIQKLYYMLEND